MGDLLGGTGLPVAHHLAHYLGQGVQFAQRGFQHRDLFLIGRTGQHVQLFFAGFQVHEPLRLDLWSDLELNAGLVIAEGHHCRHGDGVRRHPGSHRQQRAHRHAIGRALGTQCCLEVRPYDIRQQRAVDIDPPRDRGRAYAGLREGAEVGFEHDPVCGGEPLIEQRRSPLYALRKYVERAEEVNGAVVVADLPHGRRGRCRRNQWQRQGESEGKSEHGAFCPAEPVVASMRVHRVDPAAPVRYTMPQKLGRVECARKPRRPLPKSSRF